MMVDTDVLVWHLRGNEKARHAINALPGFTISAVTYMELAQGIRNRLELNQLKHFLRARSVRIELLGDTITCMAVQYVEDYALSHGLRLADALIGATARHTGETLLTANQAHYRMLPGVDLKVFRPC